MFTIRKCISGGYRLVDFDLGTSSGLMSLSQAKKLKGAKKGKKASKSRRKTASPW